MTWCSALRGRFSALHEEDGRHLNQTRAFACEVVALRFSLCLPDDEAMEYLLHELPPITEDPDEDDDAEAAVGGHQQTNGQHNGSRTTNEQSPLLTGAYDGAPQESTSSNSPAPSEFQALSSTLEGLNALEIAAVSDAKDFLSSETIQKIVDAIWVGDIALWNDVSVHAKKKARRYDPKYVLETFMRALFHDSSQCLP